jgi:hypothetical protein
MRFVYVVKLKDCYEIAGNTGTKASVFKDTLQEALEEMNAQITALVWMKEAYY